MQRFLVWYLPQAALFGLAVWFWFVTPDPPPFTAAILVGVMLAAAYTGAANLVISLIARLRRDNRQTSSDSLSLPGTRRSLSETTHQAKRLRVRE